VTVTNAMRAEAAFAIEQGLRAIERCPTPLQVFLDHFEGLKRAFAVEQGVRAIARYRIPVCGEHGFYRSRCERLGLYHANGKVTHGCIKERGTY